MDDVDRAQQLQAQLNQAALKEHLAGAAAEQPLIVGGARVCRDCREVIPWERMRLGAHIVRCVDCQAAHEKRR